MFVTWKHFWIIYSKVNSSWSKKELTACFQHLSCGKFEQKVIECESDREKLSKVKVVSYGTVSSDLSKCKKVEFKFSFDAGYWNSINLKLKKGEEKNPLRVR